MLLSGDEIGNTQHGNNNTFGQDNPIGWVNWDKPDEDLLAFVKKLTALRKGHSVLRQKRFLHSRPRQKDGIPDLFWRLPDGQPPRTEDWQRADLRTICVEVRTSSDTPAYDASDDVLFLVFNNADACDILLPPCPDGTTWEQILNTVTPNDGPVCITDQTVRADANAVQVFARTFTT